MNLSIGGHKKNTMETPLLDLSSEVQNTSTEQTEATETVEAQTEATETVETQTQEQTESTENVDETINTETEAAAQTVLPSLLGMPLE